MTMSATRVGVGVDMLLRERLYFVGKRKSSEFFIDVGHIKCEYFFNKEIA